MDESRHLIAHRLFLVPFIQNMAKKDFKDYICRPYCMFFKDGQKEEMVCQGAHIVEKLICNRKIKINTLRSFVKDPEIWIKHKEAFSHSVCRHCSFQADDCDFQSPAPSEDLEPCGGFIVLSFLKDNRLIHESDLEAVR